MALFIKTSFDNTVRKLNAQQVSLSYKNENFINIDDFKEYSDIEKTGIFNIKIHPFEAKRWYDALSKDVQDANYIIVWTGGWISVPGKTVEFFSMER